GDDVVQRAGAELLDQRDALEQRLELAELVLQQLGVELHLLERVLVALAEGVDGGRDALDRLFAELEEVVRHAAERAGDHQRLPGEPALDDLEDLADFLRVGDRAAAEFHDDHRGDIRTKRDTRIKNHESRITEEEAAERTPLTPHIDAYTTKA